MMDSKPRRNGFADAFLGVQSKSDCLQWADKFDADEYLAGYLQGQVKRRETLTTNQGE